MLLLRLWNYIRGYVIIIVEGYFLERFLNICISKGIFLWDIKREKACILSIKSGISAFKKIRHIARKTGCRIKIKSKRGLPFILYRYKKRKTFIAGCAVFVLMVYILSSFVWTVEIVGSKKLNADLVTAKLAEIGLKPGIWKPLIDTEKICNSIMIKEDGIAWVSIDISGTRAVVEISERVMPIKPIDKNTPCNIISDKDGIIKSIFVKTGAPAVTVGSTIKKGDILVSGIVESELKTVRYVHSLADIEARTWYEEAVNIPFVTIEEKDSLKEKKVYTLFAFGWNINIGSQKSPFKAYEVNSQTRQLSFGKNYIFPFGVKTITYKEKLLVKRKLSPKEAQQKAVDTITKAINIKIAKGSKIKSKKIYYYKNNEFFRARILIETIEKIGKEEIIIAN